METKTELQKVVEMNVAKSKTLRIKKYGNRKLYDEERSSYTTLDNLKESIKKGMKVEIREKGASKKEEGKDITLLTKIQILSEEAQRLHKEGHEVNFVDEATIDAIIAKMPVTEKTEKKVNQNEPNTVVETVNVVEKAA